MQNFKETIEKLLKDGLITLKESNQYPGLFVAKYKNKVFYDNLWNPELMEMRGLVIDKNYEVVALPFTKIFNRHENGTDIDLDERILSVQKINGFMAAATMTKNHGLVISTTGSLDSPFVELASKHLKKTFTQKWQCVPPNCTLIFEICDPTDPHIIKEEYGAYLIGMRYHNGNLECEWELDRLAQIMEFKRPMWGYSKFSDVVTHVKTVQHEGYVVYGKDVTLKIKSPYYLVNKLFARIRAERVNTQWLMDAKKIIDEEYYPLIDHINTYREVFIKMLEQERLNFIKEFLHG